MILLAATSKSDRAAYALMFRQLAQMARAIQDMHKATDDLRRVRGLATAVRAASMVVEASATAQTLLVERSQGGSPLPPVLTRPDEAQLQGAQSRTEETQGKNNPGIER